MKKIIIYLFYCIHCCFAAIIISILNFRFTFLQKIKKRAEVESQYFIKQCQSKNYRAVFHFSSEGELEQALFLIKKFLDKKECIKLLFTSLSVEHKVKDLCSQYPQYIDYDILYLIYPWKNKTSIRAKHFFMVRYDFYPSLFLTMNFYQELILLSASPRRFWNSSFFMKRMNLFYYSLFNRIFCSSSEDVSLLKSIGMTNVVLAEFRIAQVMNRINKSEIVLNNCFSNFSQIRNELLKKSKKQRLILGSFWASELELLIDPTIRELIVNGSLQVWIFPHLLDHAHLEQIKEQLLELFPSINVLRKNSFELNEQSSIYLVEVKGVLCEFYSFFEMAFVGGGHKKGVHSLLEPYLAGCKILCGPMVTKSTEYLLIKELNPKMIVLVDYLKSFYENYKQLNLVNEVISDKVIEINNQTLLLLDNIYE